MSGVPVVRLWQQVAAGKKCVLFRKQPLDRNACCRRQQGAKLGDSSKIRKLLLTGFWIHHGIGNADGDDFLCYFPFPKPWAKQEFE
jgi:hypothetical protein